VQITEHQYNAFSLQVTNTENQPSTKIP